MTALGRCILAALLLCTIDSQAQSQFPDLLWEFSGNTRPACSLIPMSNDRLLVCSYDGSLRIWNLATRQAGLSLIVAPWLKGRAAALLKDETIAVTGDLDGWVRLWSMETGKLLFSIGRHSAAITTVSVSPDGAWVVSGDESGVLRRWSLATRAIVDTAKLDSPIRSVIVSPDGASVVVTTRPASGKNDPMVPNPARIMDAVGLTVRSVINGSPVQSGFPAPIYCAAFLNNDTLLMTSTGAVLTVRRSDGSVLQRRDVSYDLGGPELIAVERSNSIYLAGTLFASLRRYGLSFTNADPLREFGRPIETMVVDPGARRLFTATSANDVVVWNTDADTVLFALEGSLGYTRTLAIAPDGTEIALTTTAADAVRILSAGTGLLREAVRNPPWDFSTAGSVQFDREGKTLLFISRDDNGVSRLRAYDRVARQLDTTVSWRASRAAVAPGSGSIALLRTDSILIATPDGKQIVAGARVPQLSSWCLRALNDDRFIASFVDSTVRIYNGTTGAEERVINAGTVVYDILVLSDRDLTASGPTLVFVERSSASDSTIRLDLDVRTYPNLDVVRRLQNVGTPFIDGTILNRIAASRFAREFAVGRDNGTIDIVDGTTGAVVRTRSTGGTPVVHVTCDPVQQTVYLGTADGRTARLRDAWSSPASSVDEGELSIDLEAGTCVEAWYTVDGRQIDVNALGSAPLKNTPLIMTRTVGRNRTSRFVWYP